MKNSAAPPSADLNQIRVLSSAAAVIHPVSAAAAVRRDDAPRHVSSVSSEEAAMHRGSAARKEGREGGRSGRASFIKKKKKRTTEYLRNKSGTQTVWTHEADLSSQDGSGRSSLSRCLYFCEISEMRPAFRDVFISSDDVRGGRLRCVTLPLETGSDPQTDRGES